MPIIPSKRHRGWNYDKANSRLDVYVDGTEAAYFNDGAPYLTVVNGITVSTGGLTVTAGGVTVTAGGLTVTAGGISQVAGDITMTSGQALKTTAADNSDLKIQAYVTTSSAYANGVEVQSVTGGTVEIGFFGKTPRARIAHITDATAGTHAVTINAVIAALENLGLQATA